MIDFIRKIFQKLLDVWYGILPILILVGIPIGICVAIKWKHIPKVFSALTEIGSGSWLYGILLILTCATGLLGIGYAVINAAEKIGKKLGSKWAVAYIIATSIGIFALKTIIERS